MLDVWDFIVGDCKRFPIAIADPKSMKQAVDSAIEFVNTRFAGTKYGDLVTKGKNTDVPDIQLVATPGKKNPFFELLKNNPEAYVTLEFSQNGSDSISLGEEKNSLEGMTKNMGRGKLTLTEKSLPFLGENQIQINGMLMTARVTVPFDPKGKDFKYDKD